MVLALLSGMLPYLLSFVVVSFVSGGSGGLCVRACMCVFRGWGLQVHIPIMALVTSEFCCRFWWWRCVCVCGDVWWWWCVVVVVVCVCV